MTLLKVIQHYHLFTQIKIFIILKSFDKKHGTLERMKKKLIEKWMIDRLGKNA